jgi:hypothetical protein
VRKCPKCGYILLGAVDNCTNCGEQLAASVGAAQANTTPTAPPPPEPPQFAPPPSPFAAPSAPAPQSSFGAPPAPYAAPDANSPGMYSPTAWAPAPTPFDMKVTRRRSPLLRIAIAVIIGLVLTGAGASFLQDKNALPSGTNDFAKGNGIPYSPADRSYTAQFPCAPEESSEQIPVGNSVMTMYLADCQTDNYEIGIAEAALPASIAQAQANDALDSGLQNAASGMKGSIQSKAQTTVDGFPAEDVHGKAGDGYPVRMRAIITPQHVFILMVHTKTGADRLSDALKASFVMAESKT